MKILLLLIILPMGLCAMEISDPQHYRKNDKIFYLKETHESGEVPKPSEFSEIPLQDAQNKERHVPVEIATINQDMSNKTKIIIALISALVTVGTATITGFITAYVSSKNC